MITITDLIPTDQFNASIPRQYCNHRRDYKMLLNYRINYRHTEDECCYRRTGDRVMFKVCYSLM